MQGRKPDVKMCLENHDDLFDVAGLTAAAMVKGVKQNSIATSGR